MATTLYFRDEAADTHRGTNTAKRDGTAVGWTALALATTRGATVRNRGALPINGPTDGIEATISATAIEWLSSPVAADVTISGTITANLWAAENSMSDNVAINVIVDIVRATDNSIQNVVQSTNAAEVAVTTSGVNNFTSGMTSGAYTGQTANRGDRIRVRVVFDDAGTMAANANASQMFYSGTTADADGDSYVSFTETISFEGAPGVIDQSVDVSFTAIGTSGQQRFGQPFTAVSNTLTEVKPVLYKNGSPTDDLVLTIETDSSGDPSGSVVGTVATVAGTSLTTTPTAYTYSTSISLTAGVTYWLVGTRSGAMSATDYYRIRFNTSVGVLSALEVYTGAAWTSATAGGLVVRLTFATSVLYLTDTASAVATASVDREAWTSRGAGVQTDVTNTSAGWATPIQMTDTAGGTVVDWFTRPLTAFTLGGMAVANLRALESNALANASLRCEIARVEGDGTSPTVWASWCISPTGSGFSGVDGGELTTSEATSTANVSGDDLAITDGQRLRIRVYVDDMMSAAMAASQTVTFYYAGTSAAASGDSYVTLPQSVTEYVPVLASATGYTTL